VDGEAAKRVLREKKTSQPGSVGRRSDLQIGEDRSRQPVVKCLLTWNNSGCESTTPYFIGWRSYACELFAQSGEDPGSSGCDAGW